MYIRIRFVLLAQQLRFFFETTKNIRINLQIISKLHKNSRSYSHFALTWSFSRFRRWCRFLLPFYFFTLLPFKVPPCGPIPQNMAKTFDGPPTLERSGSEHRRAVTSSRPWGFLSPRTGGTEGGVKTIEERLGEKGGAFFNGKKRCQWVQWKLAFKLPSAARFIKKEGRDDFRKTSFWLKGDGGIRKNLL